MLGDISHKPIKTLGEETETEEGKQEEEDIFISGRRITVIDLKHKFDEAETTHVLDLTGCEFIREAFGALASYFIGCPSLEEMHFSKKHLTKEQQKVILTAATKNLMKGVSLYDEGRKYWGTISADWNYQYNEEKEKNFVEGLNPATKIAVEKYEEEHGKKAVIIFDVGAHSGKETLPLLRDGYEVVAIDAQRSPLEFLRSRAEEAGIYEKLTIYAAPFLKFTFHRKADVLFASHTVAYRPEEDFPPFWEKFTDCVKIGGFIAIHLYENSTKFDPSMTFHTEKQIKELFSKNYEVVEWFQGDEGVKIYGGDEGNWEVLHHIVAMRKK